MDDYEFDAVPVTEDEIQMMLFANICKYRGDGVICVKKERPAYACKKCGWNPQVERYRIRQIRKKREEENAAD